MKSLEEVMAEMAQAYGEDGRETEFNRNSRVSGNLMQLARVITADMPSFMTGFQLAVELVRIHPEWIAEWSKVRPSALMPHEDPGNIDALYEKYANSIVLATPIHRMSEEEVKAQIEKLVNELSNLHREE